MAENEPQTPVPSPFHKAFYAGLVSQLLFVILAALILDGGGVLRIVILLAIPYFVMVLWIGHNRPEKPSSGDLFFVRFAPLFFFIVAFLGGSFLSNCLDPIYCPPLSPEEIRCLEQEEMDKNAELATPKEGGDVSEKPISSKNQE